jgi:release factor glutamine methyltransferase
MMKWRRNSTSLQVPSLFPAFARQRERLLERKRAGNIHVNVCGREFEIFPGVYQTSVDTELMSQAVRILPNESFLEIGCGCGAISLLLAQKSRVGVGVDINPTAIKNSEWNRQKSGTSNVTFLQSDVFENVTGKFDVLICNPPYNHYPAEDAVERMFWDPYDDMKHRFFGNAPRFLKDNGRIYFGWADFADLDTTLPLRLAEKAGFRYSRHILAPSKNGVQLFFVIELLRERSCARENLVANDDDNEVLTRH